MLAWWACKSGVPLPAIWKCNPWVVGSSWTKRYDIRYEPSRNVGVANKIPQVVFTLDDLPVHHKATQRQLLTHVHTWGRIRAGLDKSRLLGGSVPCFPGKHCLTHSGLSGSGVSRRSEQGQIRVCWKKSMNAALSAHPWFRINSKPMKRVFGPREETGGSRENQCISEENTILHQKWPSRDLNQGLHALRRERRPLTHHVAPNQIKCGQNIKLKDEREREPV